MTEKTILRFTDLNNAKHFVNLTNLNNVVVREQAEYNVLAFHMNNQSVVPITVDRSTAERLMIELGEAK